MGKYLNFAAAAAMALMVGSTSSQAVPFDFFKIGGDGADVGGQLTVDVTENVDGKISFLFENLGPTASSITRIYFHSGPLASLDAIVNGTGVNFIKAEDAGTPPVTPSDLPGGTGVGFDTVAAFTGGSTNPRPANGVNPFESVQFLFSLKNLLDFDDVIAALISGDLRIGLFVQSIGDDGESAQFVNNLNPIPLPAGLVLFLSGLVGIGVLGRYKAKRRELTTEG